MSHTEEKNAVYAAILELLKSEGQTKLIVVPICTITGILYDIQNISRLLEYDDLLQDEEITKDCMPLIYGVILRTILEEPNIDFRGLISTIFTVVNETYKINHFVDNLHINSISEIIKLKDKIYLCVDEQIKKYTDRGLAGILVDDVKYRHYEDTYIFGYLL